MLVRLLRSNPYGWVVVAVLFLVLSFAMVARSAIGLLMPTWETELGWERTFVSGGGAVMLIVMAVGAPVAGLLLDRFGSRIVYVVALAIIALSTLATAGMTQGWHFILVYCVIGGIGFAAISAPMIATSVVLYFEENRGLATGIAASGATGGQLVLMPLLALGATALGWRASFVVLGLAVIAIGVLAFYVVRRKAGGTARSGRDETDDSLYEKLRTVASNRTVWLLFGGFFVCGFTTVGAIRVHLLPYARRVRISANRKRNRVRRARHVQHDRDDRLRLTVRSLSPPDAAGEHLFPTRILLHSADVYRERHIPSVHLRGHFRDLRFLGLSGRCEYCGDPCRASHHGADDGHSVRRPLAGRCGGRLLGRLAL